MRIAPLCVLLAAGCSNSPPSLALTDGVQVQIDGCPFTITTPAETTAPVKDDGAVGMMPAPKNVHLSWVGDPTTTMSVTWATDVGTRGTTLEWGADASYGHRTPGFWFAYPTDFGGADPPSEGMHQVHLCGLQPGTTYHYRVGTGSAWSDDATFSTMPADGRPVRVLVFGDSRNNVATWAQVMQAGAADAPDFALFTGDAVELGTEQDSWDAWFDAGKGVLDHLPMMTVHGNHEINARHYYSQFPMPGNQQWYSFDVGAAHFTALNDTPVDMSTIAGVQAQFLDADLGKTTQPWKLVTHHRPEYTSSSGHPPATDLQMAWESILDQHHVDLVLDGHAHAYERSYPLVAGAKVADGQGPVYVVEGGGGADPYTLALQPFTATGAQTFGYVILDVTPQQLTLTAKALDGSVVDTYSLSK